MILSQSAASASLSALTANLGANSQMALYAGTVPAGPDTALRGSALNIAQHIAARWLEPLTAAMTRWQINTPKRQAAFLAQVGVESEHLQRLVESLDYAADALIRQWPTRFTAALAQQIGRTAEHPADQAAIANYAYGNRFDNGDVASGDGFRFRGRGLVQVTFRANYRAAGAALGIDLLADPDLLLAPEHAAQSAAWFWQTHGLNALADAGDFARITLRINGGMTGQTERVALLNAGMEALA